MSETENPNAPPPSPAPRLRWGVVAVAAALALAAIVYGTTRDAGKESAGATASCAASAQTAARVAPLAKGEVAALIVPKSPRPATDVSFDGPDGRRVTLADFRGKTVLLNLWATWCAPCRAEMPALDRLQAKLGGDDFEVVAVNIDTARLDRRQAFLEETKVASLAFYADPKADIFQDLKRAGKAVGLPTTLLIDPEGCELGVMAGPAEWDSPDAVALVKAALKR